MPRVKSATAVAHPNIALAKYWGKRGFGHNLPAVPSLSVTLAGMATTTTVTFDESLTDDELILGGMVQPPGGGAHKRAAGLLDRVRAASNAALRARVESANDFPTASGLASSASAFAALALAATEALALGWPSDRVSDLARRTSVSSARSVFGGFVELRAGVEGDEGDKGDDILSAAPVAPSDHLPLRVVVAVTKEGPKDIGSTEGMLHTTLTSPYYPAWVDSAPALFEGIKRALLDRDLEALGALAEASALRMHAAAIAAVPGLLYWNAATVRVLSEVKLLRARGTPAFFTIDAGPHVKVLTTPEDEPNVTRFLSEIPGVLRTIVTQPGAGARITSAVMDAYSGSDLDAGTGGEWPV